MNFLNQEHHQERGKTFMDNALSGMISVSPRAMIVLYDTRAVAIQGLEKIAKDADKKNHPDVARAARQVAKAYDQDSSENTLITALLFGRDPLVLRKDAKELTRRANRQRGSAIGRGLKYNVFPFQSKDGLDLSKMEVTYKFRP